MKADPRANGNRGAFFKPNNRLMREAQRLGFHPARDETLEAALEEYVWQCNQKHTLTCGISNITPALEWLHKHY
jgi:hypothetical protein